MFKPVSQQNYNHLRTLYDKLYFRLNKHFSQGRFFKFSKQKQQLLLQKLEKLIQKLEKFNKGLKLAGFSILAATGLYTTDVQAQIGNEFLVNTTTTNSQLLQSSAMDNNGNFIIAWHDYTQGIVAQRYNSLGAPQGTEQFIVDGLTPSVALDNSGNFVVTYAKSDGSGDGIFARRYNSSGIQQGSEFQVNTNIINWQKNPLIAMDSDGNFVIAWEGVGTFGMDWDVFAQRYNSLGVAQGTEFRVNTYTTNVQWEHSIAMNNDGAFVITWASYLQLDNWDIFAQRFDALGVPQGGEFQVNSYTSTAQSYPNISMNKATDGDFIITWGGFEQDGDRWGIYAQQFDAFGSSIGSEFQVNSYTTSDQSQPSVAMDTNGDYVVSWQSKNQDGSDYGIYAKHFNSWGGAQGSEFKVNTYTTDKQNNPCIKMDSSGDFLITWQSNNQDGNLYGIYAQRYSAIPSSVVDKGQPESIKLYPNPAKGQVQFSLLEPFTLCVKDISGKEMTDLILIGNTLNISTLNPGIYIIELTKDGSKSIEKIIVE